MQYSRLIYGSVVFLSVAMAVSTLETWANAENPSQEIIAEFELDPKDKPVEQLVEAVHPDGTLQLVPVVDEPQDRKKTLSKGYWLGVVLKKPRQEEGACLVLVRIEAIQKDGIAARVGRDAVKQISRGYHMELFRPEHATTEQLVALPKISTISQGNPPIELSGDSPDDFAAEGRVQLLTSINKMKRLGLGLHNYAASFGSFPPAVVYGPDGKPWHSWRALILPYIEPRAAMYKQHHLGREYRLDEPWNGPNNKRLLKMRPEIFTGVGKEDDRSPYTWLAAITGPGTAFPVEGASMENGKPDLGGGTKYKDILDGTSDTLLLGPVSAEAKIPWTKPEDIVLGDPPSKLGAAEGFALPFRMDQQKVGPFLLADGEVIVLSESSDYDQYRKLLTMAGHERVDVSTLVVPSEGAFSPGPPAFMLTIIRQGNQTAAYIHRR